MIAIQTNHANGIADVARFPVQPSRCIMGSRSRKTWTRARPLFSRMVVRLMDSMKASRSNMITVGASVSA